MISTRLALAFNQHSHKVFLIQEFVERVHEKQQTLLTQDELDAVPGHTVTIIATAENKPFVFRDPQDPAKLFFGTETLKQSYATAHDVPEFNALPLDIRERLDTVLSETLEELTDYSDDVARGNLKPIIEY